MSPASQAGCVSSSWKGSPNTSTDPAALVEDPFESGEKPRDRDQIVPDGPCEESRGDRQQRRGARQTFGGAQIALALVGEVAGDFEQRFGRPGRLALSGRRRDAPDTTAIERADRGFVL